MKASALSKKEYNSFLALSFFFCLLISYFNTSTKFELSLNVSNKVIVDSNHLEKKLINFKYSKYKNKSISELLKGLDISYQKIIFVQMKPQYLSFVTVVYSKDIHLDIYTDNYKYLKRELQANESYEEMWKIEDLMKEQVTKIRVRRSKTGASLKEYPKKPILPVV